MYKTLRQDSRIAIRIPGSSHSDILDLLQLVDTFVYPPLCLKCNVIPALIQVVASLVVCFLCKNVPYFCNMTLVDIDTYKFNDKFEHIIIPNGFFAVKRVIGINAYIYFIDML